MPDWMDPADVMATNPYRAPQPLDRLTLIGNLLMGAGAGISQADASGRGWASGIAPGLMTGFQMNNALQRQSEEQDLRRAQYGRMLEHSRMQDEATRAKMSAPALSVQPPPVQMRPDSSDARLAGYEGSNKNGGMASADMTRATRERHDVAAAPAGGGYLTNMLLNNPYMRAALMAQRAKNDTR